MTKQVRQLDRVVIRFAGDSGDGMQLTGDRFTSETAQLGNDISTLPNFPAEIRAPAGTLPGVSSFQVHFADFDILTPGDAPNVLVAMNPAALKANIADLPRGADIIVNTDEFTKRNLTKVGYATNPLEDGSLDGYALHPVGAHHDDGAGAGDVRHLEEGRRAGEEHVRARACSPGCTPARTSRPSRSCERKFAARPELVAANMAAFKAGWNFGETTEDFGVRYEVKPAKMTPGNYRNITGNVALALGLVAAGVRSRLPVFLGAYPITPASDILHELSKHKRFNVTTMQAEDEIAAVGAALGAAYGGALGVTTTSGPGVALKGETISLAIALELPLVIVDVQRAGPPPACPPRPSRPTSTWRCYGRHGEAPAAVIAPRSPADCFFAAIEAARIALTYRTPVLLLSDGYIANGSEPWLLPDVADLPDLRVEFATAPNGEDGKTFLPYLRDPHDAGPTVGGAGHARPAAPHRRPREGRQDRRHLLRPGQPRLHGAHPGRADRGDRGARHRGRGPRCGYAARGCSCSAGARRTGRSAPPAAPCASAACRSPRPTCATSTRCRRNLDSVLRRYDKVVIPEMNLGQLAHVIRGRYLVDAIPYNQVRGLPFTAAELESMLEDVVKNA